MAKHSGSKLLCGKLSHVSVARHVWPVLCEDLAGELGHNKSAQRISSGGEKTVFTNPWETGTERDFTQEVPRFPAFSWCEDVRRAEDLRDRPDIPTPLFRGSRDGLPNWVDRVGSCGNAVVPQIPEMIGHAILAAQSRNAEGV